MSRAALAGIALSVVGAGVQADDLFVDSLCGDDSWSGTSPFCGGPSGPKRTIAAALAGAQNGDALLISPGTYAGFDFAGLELHVRGLGDPDTVVITGEVHFQSGEGRASLLESVTIQGPFSGVRISGSSTPTLRDVRFSGCAFSGVSISGGSSASIEICSFNACSDAFGGGISVGSGGSVEVFGTLFDTNTAANDGGAIHVDSGTLMVESCVFQGNTAGLGGLGGGGGIALVAPQVSSITNSVFDQNDADLGAAVWVSGGSACAVGSSFENGQATRGGALYVEGSASFGLRGATVIGNTATERGGAIHVGAGATVDVVNAQLTGNQAPLGSAIDLWSDVAETAVLTMVHGTLEGNVADPSGGAVRADGLGSSVSAANSILWGNGLEPVVGNVDITASLVEHGYPGGNCSLDPLFANPAAGNYALAAASPAIDRGKQAHLPADVDDLDGDLDVLEPLSQDLAGNDRVAWNDVDLGAFEQVALGATVCEPACELLDGTCLEGDALAASTATGRLTGTASATAFLVASDGVESVVLSAAHAVPVGAAGVTFEAGAACSGCLCGSVTTPSSFAVAGELFRDAGLDFVLLRVSGDPAASFGIVPVDRFQPHVLAELTGVQHPLGGVRGMAQGQVSAALVDLASQGCFGTAEGLAVVLPSADGSQGGPLLRPSGSGAVAVLTCPGSCDTNTFAVPMGSIVDAAETAMAQAGFAFTETTEPPDTLLVGDVPTVSVTSGGTQMLTIAASPDFAGRSYLVVGGISGTTPGIDFGAVHVPLVVDFLTVIGMTSPNEAPYVDSFGTLGLQGEATASLVIDAGVLAAFPGLHMDHVALVLNTGLATVLSSSAPVGLTLGV